MNANIDAKRFLVDVIALSKKLCAFPIQGQLAYATTENFLGRIVDGYSFNAQDVCLLTKKVAFAACDIQQELNKEKLGLLIYDAYRPLRAVKDFAKWFHEPVTSKIELERKAIHYPNVSNKADLVSLGYAPDSISRHNFGNVIDATLINIKTLVPLEMGACFDYFDELSHNTATIGKIGIEAYNNRKLLSIIMQKHGFIPYEKEFWHFDYHLQEVAKPLDIPIEENLRGLNV